MRNSYGHQKVDFSSVRVVRYCSYLEDIPDIEEIYNRDLVALAKEKLTDEELQALTKTLKKG